jgi:hypothetical protein
MSGKVHLIGERLPNFYLIEKYLRLHKLIGLLMFTVFVCFLCFFLLVVVVDVFCVPNFQAAGFWVVFCVWVVVWVLFG